ncbi:MAG: FtsX-like permease family protein [Bacillota bacterium]
MIRSKHRTLLTFGGMVMAGVFLTLVLTANSGFGKVLSRPLRELVGGDLLIVPSGVTYGRMASGYPGIKHLPGQGPTILNYEALLRQAGQAPNVSLPNPGFIMADVFTRSGQMVPIMARDFRIAFDHHGFGSRLAEGRGFQPSDEGELVVLLSPRYQPTVPVGGRIELLFPRIYVDDGHVRYDYAQGEYHFLTVVGRYNFSLPFPTQVALVPFSTFCRLTGLPAGHSFFVSFSIQDFNYEAATVAWFRERLPDVRVFGPQDLYRIIVSGMQSEGLELGTPVFTVTFTGLMYLVAALIIANTMYLSAVQRQRDVAIMLAMGARPGQVRRTFLAEAILLSLTGSLTGYGLTSFFIFLSTAGRTDALGDLGAITLRNGAVIAAVTVLAAVVAGSLPAWYASRVQPMEVLRYE